MRVILAFPALAVLLIAGGFAIGDAILAPTPVAKDPGFVDTVLASRAVIAAIRLAIIAAGVFIVLSVVALISKGQWLTRVGPVEVSEQVSDFNAENQQLEELIESMTETIDDLRQEAAYSNRLLDQIERDSEGIE